MTITRPTTIFLVGEISSGKSSFLNSLAGGIISSTSVQRETFNPLNYIFSTKGSNKNILSLTKQLDEDHTKNEKSRNNIKDLKEGDIKLIFKNDDDTKLKTKHGLNDIHIVDFPGINDGEDSNNLFFKVIEQEISKCDLLLYITKSNSAFASKSEIDNFYKLVDIIEKQNEEGNYMDYAIIVNKFDEIDNKDYNEIYYRIHTKLNIDNEKIFRYSSHKMLINCVIDNEMELTIPNFMSTEIIKILKNADVTINKKLKKIIRKDKKINHKLMILDDSDDSDYEDTESCEYTGEKGDWDNLMNFIKDFQVTRRNNFIKLMKNRFDHLMKTSAYINSTRYHYNDNLILLMKQFNKYVIKLENDNIEYEELLDKVLDKYINRLAGEKKEMFIRSISSNYISKYLKLLNYLYLKCYDDVTKVFIVYNYRSYNSIKNCIIKLLKNKIIWTDFDSYYYSAKENKIINGIDRKKEFIHSSWFINNLLNDSHPDVQILLRLSQMKIYKLKILMNLNKLPKKLILEIDENAFIRLLYYIEKLNKNEKLERKLFEISYNDKNDFDKFKEIYNLLL